MILNIKDIKGRKYEEKDNSNYNHCFSIRYRSSVVYKIIEKDVTDRETFDFKTNTNGSIDTVSHDEHSFYGKIIEVSSSYIIVEPNEKEEERKSSDKFHIELKNDTTTYKVGTNVNITYVGDINESYPAKIGTTKIEIVS